LHCEEISEERLDELRLEFGKDRFFFSGCAYLDIEDGITYNAKYAHLLYESIELDRDDSTFDKLERFFQENKDVHGISLLKAYQTAIYKDGQWYRERNISKSLIEIAFSYKMPKRLEEVYQRYSPQLKRMLDERSFFLYSLLVGNRELKPKDFAVWDNPVHQPYIGHESHHARNSISQLLDILVVAGRYDVISYYRDQLLSGYEGNPFRYAWLKHPEGIDTRINESVSKLKNMGFNFYHYTDNYNPYEICNDNLMLSIYYDVKDDVGWYRKATRALMIDLASKIEDCDDECVMFYLEGGIKYQGYDSEAFGDLLNALPKRQYTDEEVSRLIFFAAKYNSHTLMKIFFDAFEVQAYTEFEDFETGFRALDFAKKNRNEPMIALLEEHGYGTTNRMILSRGMSGIADTAKGVKDTASGIGYAVQLLLFGYH
jgi:(2Fe-2S) ferredoxin